jgi:MFS family permease
MESEEEASRRGKKGMVIALAASYFTVMGAKCALPTVLPLLLDPTVGLVFSDKWNLSPQELVSRQLTLATLAVAVGKLLLGPVIDRFGGILSLQVALSMLGVLLAAISLGSSFLGFAIGWIFVDFIFSSCWAACINAIHQSFPPDQWARQIGTLAAAAFAAVLQFCS